jgi:hypothetical protein
VRPEVRGFSKAVVDGTAIGRQLEEERLINEFVDPKEAYRIVHEPLTAIAEIPPEQRKQDTGSYYDAGSGNFKPQIDRLSEAYNSNVEEVDVSMYFELSDGEYEFEFVPRTDFDPRKRIRPPSFVELLHRPDRHASTVDGSEDEMKRLSLRYAHDFNSDFLENAGMKPETYVNEMPLLSAFYREGGVRDQLSRSAIPFSPVLRDSLRVLPYNTGSVADFMASDTTPYVSEYLTDDPGDGGMSREEIEEAGRHIGTTKALGLSFGRERERGEIFGQFDREFGRSLVNIDPEGAHYVPGNTDKLDRDERKFVQQTTPLGSSAHHAMEEESAEIVGRAKNSSKAWQHVLEEELPKRWETEMPSDMVLGDI